MPRWPASAFYAPCAQAVGSGDYLRDSTVDRSSIHSEFIAVCCYGCYSAPINTDKEVQVMGLIDKDAQAKRNNYMRIQRRLLQMRRDGRMPYSWITDGSRTIYGYERFANEDDFSAYAANIYRKDYWLESPVRVEVWVEKDAMAGKLKPVVRDEYGLDLYVSRGFASETYLQEAGAHIRSDGRPTYVYLLTDFDASGIGIAETVEEKLAEMARPVDVFVERIAATPSQIEEYGLI